MARSERRLWRYFAALALLTAVLVPVGFHYFQGQAEKSDDQAKESQKTARVVGALGKELSQEVLRACRAGGDDAKVLEDAGLCVQADVTKETIEKATPTPPVRTRFIPPDPTELQALIAQAVARCTTDGPCKPQKGEKGEAGPPPTFEQVVLAVQQTIDAALTRVCGGDCKGEPGQSIVGPKGPKGDKGDSLDPGTYECGPFQSLHGFTVNDDGSVTLDCRAV
jgi:hypothetical protein